MADFNLLDAIRSGLGGLLPQQYAQQQQQQPQGPSFGERAGAGFQNFTQSDSPLSALGNLVSGLQTGSRTDPLGRQNAAMTATYQSLVGAGVHPSVAAAATMNPEILKTIAPAYFDTQPKLVETGQDPFSQQKSFSTYNPQRQTLTPIGGTPGQTSSGGLGAFQEAANKGVTGEDLYNYLPPSQRPIVKAMIEGRRPAPTGMGMRNPVVMAQIEAAHAIDPNFDEANWAKRVALVKDYQAGGKQFQELQAIGTVSNHLENLAKAATALDNYQIPQVNSIVNYLSKRQGDPRVDRFNYTLHVVSDELAKAYHAGRVTDAEVKGFNNAIDSSSSPAQLRGVIGDMNDLLKGKRDSLESGYSQGMGPIPAPGEFAAETAAQKQRFDNVNKYAHPELYGNAPAQAGVPAQVPAQAPPAVGSIINGHRFKGGDPRSKANWEPAA